MLWASKYFKLGALSKKLCFLRHSVVNQIVFGHIFLLPKQSEFKLSSSREKRLSNVCIFLSGFNVFFCDRRLSECILKTWSKSKLTNPVQWRFYDFTSLVSDDAPLSEINIPLQVTDLNFVDGSLITRSFVQLWTLGFFQPIQKCSFDKSKQVFAKSINAK